MRDFFVGLVAITVFVVVSLILGATVCNFMSLDPQDDNLLVKGVIGVFVLIGGFIFVMLCVSIGVLFQSKKK